MRLEEQRIIGEIHLSDPCDELELNEKLEQERVQIPLKSAFFNPYEFEACFMLHIATCKEAFHHSIPSTIPTLPEH